MSSVNIVTALFDIRREGMDGRMWEDYVKWFEQTLRLKVPMTIFVSEELQEFVQERRLHAPTNLIIQKVEKIPLYHLKEYIDSVLFSDTFKSVIKDPKRIECQHALYSIVQYSKFYWLERAIEEGTDDYYFWLDAGSSRFFEDYDFSESYPSAQAIECLNGIGDRLLIQMNTEYYPDLANAEELPLEYLCDNRSYVLGSMFGGSAEAIQNVKEVIMDIFYNDMLKNGFVNNEQIALGYLIKQEPQLFEIYYRNNSKHLALFDELATQ
jgi:hypothetical protein